MTHVRKCELCGDEFVAKRKDSRFCYKEHMRECVICDSKFKVVVPNKPAIVCSQRCVGKLSVRNEAKGFRNVERICNFPTCKGKFTPKSSRQKYCTKQHEIPCEICGVNFKVRQNHRPGRVCSRRCSDLLNTTEAGKRGKNKTIKKECKLCKKDFMTNRSNQVYCKMPHPMECFSCGIEFKIERAYEGRLKYSCGKINCRQKLIESTNNKKYGVQNVFQSEEVKQKAKETNLKNLGVEHPSQNKNVMKKVHNTMIERYGANVPMRVPELKKAIMNTNINRYGASNPGLFNINNLEDYLNFYDFVKTGEKSVRELIQYFNVSEKTIRSKIIENNIESLFPNFFTLSKSERKIFEMLEENDDLKISLHNRKVIKPQEIDIYLSNIKVGIEVSPTYTHNSKRGWGGIGKGLDRNYHYDKFKVSDDNDIELITLFDWYDYHKVANYIKSLVDKEINMNEVKLGERICDKEVSTKYTLWNLELNPKVPSNDKMTPIYCGDELVAIIVSNKDGYRINISEIIQSPEYSRNSLLTKIINLLKEKYRSIHVTTDSNITNGSILKELGFSMTNEINPSLIYVNVYNKEYVKCYNINVVTNVLKNKGLIEGGDSNSILLEKKGFLPVYDCGQREFKLEV